MVRRRRSRRSIHPKTPDLQDDEPTLIPEEVVATPSGPRESRSSIKSTPVNRRRRSSFNTLNVTNLNILFDSSYINQGTPPSETTPTNNYSTQTSNHQEIVETPKMSQLIEELLDPQEKSKIYYLDSQVNQNPYVQNNEFKILNRDPSLAELSCSTSQFYNLKLASTPIDRIASSIMKDSPIRDSPNNNVKINNFDAVKVEKFGFQSSPFHADKTEQEKLLNSSKIRPLRPHFTIVHNLSKISKTNSSYKTFHLDENERGTMEIIFTRLKKLSRTSITWTFKLLEWCSYIGIAVKKSLTSLVQATPPACECSAYLQNCNIEIEQLRSELVQVRGQVEYQKICQNDIMEEFNKLKSQFETLQSFRNDIEEKLKAGPIVSMTPIVAAPPPPPPPPPPPLLQKVTTTKVKKNSSARSNNKENSRPIISLDDILQVKLKKTGERPVTGRRGSVPVVSTEMLRQVKLKPPSRQPPPILEATSPISSLTRLLSDSSVWRVKRLNRVGGYSFDDISRRSQQVKRERERSYN